MSGSESPDIELFTQQYCSECHEVAQFLQDRGVEFTTRSVDRDPEALELLIAKGYMSTPVVRIGDTWIAGFKRRELERLLGR